MGCEESCEGLGDAEDHPTKEGTVEASQSSHHNDAKIFDAQGDPDERGNRKEDDIEDPCSRGQDCTNSEGDGANAEGIDPHQHSALSILCGCPQGSSCISFFQKKVDSHCQKNNEEKPKETNGGDDHFSNVHRRHHIGDPFLLWTPEERGDIFDSQRGSQRDQDGGDDQFVALPLQEGSDQTLLEEETDYEKKGDEDQGEEHGIPFRRHKEDIAKEAAEHEKFTMGEVKNIGDTED